MEAYRVRLETSFVGCVLHICLEHVRLLRLLATVCNDGVWSLVTESAESVEISEQIPGPRHLVESFQNFRNETLILKEQETNSFQNVSPFRFGKWANTKAPGKRNKTWIVVPLALTESTAALDP